MSLLIAVAVLALGSAALTRLSPSVEEIKSRFELAQTYYAARDYENAVDLFEDIARTENRRLLNVDSITVAIDDLVLPVRISATYQVGNSYRNVGVDLLKRAELARLDGEEAVAQQRRAEAFSALQAAKKHFADLAGAPSVPYELRAMSQYQIVRADYVMEDFAAVVEDVHRLLQDFPGNAYEEAGLYDLAWARLRMQDFQGAIETFAQVLARSQDAVRVDRSLFQIAEAHGALGNAAEALVWYQKLIDKYDFEKIPEKELRNMQAAKLRGIVQETARELVAKAQIKVGDTHAAAGQVEAAMRAYGLVPQRYPQETYLVEQSYARLAVLLLEERGLDAGLRVYREAIEKVDNPEFKAMSQLQIAGALFDAGRYADAIGAYQVYLRAYGDLTRVVGFTEDKVLFKIGEAHRNAGLEEVAADSGRAAASLMAAAAHYDSLISLHAHSELVPDARFGKGISYQGLGRMAEARELFAAIARQYPDHAVAPRALMQVARLTYGSGDYEGAIAVYESLITAHPGADLIDDARLELGVAYKAARRIDEAVAILSRVGRVAPEWVRVQLEIADLLTASGRYEEAENNLDEAIARAESDAQVLAALYYIKGKIAYSQRAFAEAIRALGAAVAGGEGAELNASSLFLKGLAHYELARQFDAEGDSTSGWQHYDRAAADLRAVLDHEVSAKMRNVAYRTLGTANARLGRSAETIRSYEALIAGTGDSRERAGFRILLLELHFDQGHFDETEQVARELIAEDFEDSDEMGYFLKERAYSILCSVKLERREYAAARHLASEGLARYPKSAESATMAFVGALAQYFLQDFEGAASSFEEYADLYPADARASEALYYAALCHQIGGQYARAALWFRRLADRSGEAKRAAEALFLCAENLYNNLQFEAALATYDELLQRFPDGEFADDALYSSAWALFQQNRGAEGAARMRELVQRFPESMHAPRAHFTIGDYLYSAQDFASAQEAYAQIERLYPGSPEVPRARELVLELEEQIASNLYERAVALYQENKHREAIDVYRAVVEHHPDTFSALAALGNMGVALERIGERQEAREAYEQVLSRAESKVQYQDVADFARARLKHL